MARLLVIEDDELALGLLVKMLEREGHEVVSAVDGAEGVRRFEEGSFDAVVTDLVMPKKEGFQAILEIRERDPHVPILAISGGSPARPPEGILAAAARAGATGTLQKPFSRRQLAEALARLFGQDGGED